MTEKVVSVRLQARVEGFTAGMRKAKKSVDDLTKADVPKAAKGYKDLADKAALAGAAMAVGLGVAVKRFADFDKAMSAVKANVGGTAAEMESLRKAAIQLGADSQFTATEAAQGINELGKAGIKSADILNGGLKGALDLAAAGQIEVAQAAETTASAMTQFNLKGDKAVHVADLLASGANKAQGGVGDLGAALGQTGLVASAMGLSIEETVGGLTAFASAGLIGSDAGTSFKTTLQRLQAPVGDAAQMLKKYNISAYDAQGNFVGLADVAGQLNEKFKGLTPEVRNNAMAVIFGSDAVRASTILYKEGADGINKWVGAVDETGAAAKQAATLTDNLSGDIERLGGAFDTALIQTGSGANASLRTLVQGLEGLVTTVAKIPGPVLLAGAGLAAIALGVPKGLLAFKNYRATLDSVGLSFEKIAARGPRAEKAINGVTKAGKGLGILAATLAAGGIVDQIFGPDTTHPGADSLTRDLLKADDSVAAFSARMKQFADESSNWWSSNQVTDFGSAVNDVFNTSTTQKIDDAAGSLTSVFGIGNNSDVANANAAFKDLDTILSGLVSGGNADEAARQFKQFADAAAAQGVSVDQLRTKLPGYEGALAGVDNAAVLAAGSTDKFVGTTDDVTGAAEDAETALKNLKDAIDGFGAAALDQRAAERDFQESIDDAADRIKKRVELQKELKAAEAEPAKTKEDRKRKAEEIARITDELKKYGKGFDANTESGRANQEVLDNIVQATKDKVKADIDAAGGLDNLEASTKAGTTAMDKGREAFIKAATEAGATKTEAKALADQLGLIPENVKIAVSQSGASAASTAIDQAARDRTAMITVSFTSTGLQRLTNGVNVAVGVLRGEKVEKKATGGAIYGAGTGTSDSIPAWLSNGEHVWTASEVAKLGGQSAMYALRAAVRNGSAPGFASGGAVRYAPAVSYAGPTSHSTTNDSRFQADSVTIVTPDANSFKREIRTAPYRAKGRPGR